MDSDCTTNSATIKSVKSDDGEEAGSVYSADFKEEKRKDKIDTGHTDTSSSDSDDGAADDADD